MKLKLLILALGVQMAANAQTEIDGLMMEQHNLCVGAVYGHSSWTNYWEGGLKRDNLNLGTVTAQSLSVNANYGITGKLNIIATIPFVQTSASAGQLAGQQGLQDLSLFVKWMPYEKDFSENATLSFYAIGGYRFPVSNYVADFLPMSIGLRSQTASLRLMADYQGGNFFGTVSGAYMLRNNIQIDRNAYYTTQMNYTNQVSMPNQWNLNLRGGYRTERLIAEAVLDHSYTLGGFDISRNNMPFPSNQMNATTLGIHTKYNFTFLDGLALIAGGNYTIDGRNVGQNTNFYGGFFYLMDISKKQSGKTPEQATTNE
jgi:hypothetical protein